MPKYTLRQLLTFIEVARESSVSRAAERLFVTQPAVSMQLRQLEDAFGVALVEPSGRNIRLTNRQDVQVHFVAKRHVREFVRRVNELGLTTLGACGDINRNVMASPFPFVAPAYSAARTAAPIHS